MNPFITLCSGYGTKSLFDYVMIHEQVQEFLCTYRNNSLTRATFPFMYALATYLNIADTYYADKAVVSILSFPNIVHIQYLVSTTLLLPPVQQPFSFAVWFGDFVEHKFYKVSLQESVCKQSNLTNAVGCETIATAFSLAKVSLYNICICTFLDIFHCAVTPCL